MIHVGIGVPHEIGCVRKSVVNELVFALTNLSLLKLGVQIEDGVSDLGIAKSKVFLGGDLVQVSPESGG